MGRHRTDELDDGYSSHNGPRPSVAGAAAARCWSARRVRRPRGAARRRRLRDHQPGPRVRGRRGRAAGHRLTRHPARRVPDRRALQQGRATRSTAGAPPSRWPRAPRRPWPTRWAAAARPTRWTCGCPTRPVGVRPPGEEPAAPAPERVHRPLPHRDGGLGLGGPEAAAGASARRAGPASSRRRRRQRRRPGKQGPRAGAGPLDELRRDWARCWPPPARPRRSAGRRSWWARSRSCRSPSPRPGRAAGQPHRQGQQGPDRRHLRTGRLAFNNAESRRAGRAALSGRRHAQPRLPGGGRHQGRHGAQGRRGVQQELGTEAARRTLATRASAPRTARAARRSRHGRLPGQGPGALTRPTTRRWRACRRRGPG